jgi:hypothetical protein
MTEETKKFDKVSKGNPSFEDKPAPRKSVQDRAGGRLNIPKDSLDPAKAYRWALQNDLYGRDDYGDCFEMGYRDTQLSSLKGFIKSDSTEKVMRKLNSGTFILMEAPLHYRQLTADEVAQTNEDRLKAMMPSDRDIGNGSLTIQ